MLSLRARKALLGIHILLLSIWMGTLFAILFLLLSKHSRFAQLQIDVIDKSVFLLFDSIVMNVAIAVTISGLIFSMFTNWGFFKFDWIITKWIVLVILTILIIFFSSPVVNGMTALSDVYKSQVKDHNDYQFFERQVLLYTIIQLFLLTFVVFISALKPWGQRKFKININRKIVVSIGIISGLLLGTSAISQYLQLSYYRNLPIYEVRLDSLSDGYYLGKYDYYFEYEVGVSIENQAIRDVKILNNRNNHYARLAEGIKYKIIREQKIDINAISGATTTSKIFLKAIELALKNDQNNKILDGN
jgi:uncharacterized protein with FMN-binding domain